MKVKLILAQNITKEYMLPRELGALCSDCWNAGHDGVNLECVSNLDALQSCNASEEGE